MVTNLHEGMSDKCSQYWPEVEGETEVYGECEVSLLSACLINYSRPY
jgi:protein tyrosine phosphatase